MHTHRGRQGLRARPMSRAWIGLRTGPAFGQRGLASVDGDRLSCPFHLSVVPRTDSLRGRNHSGAIGSCARLEVDAEYTQAPLPDKRRLHNEMVLLLNTGHAAI